MFHDVDTADKDWKVTLHWLRQWHFDRSLAFHTIPNSVYSELRSLGYIDSGCDLTDRALSLIGER
jgi:hypothetical protein